MNQHRLREFGHVRDRRRQPPIQQRPRPHRQHQRLRCPRPRTPGQAVGQIATLRLSRPAGADKVKDRLDHLLADRHPADHALGLDQFLGGKDLVRLGLFGPGGGDQDVAFGLAGRIFDVHLHQEAVKLRLGQGIGAFLLDRVLGGKDVKRLAQGPVLAGDGHLFLLHRLQKRRLRPGRSSVDLVGHQQLAEDRPFDKAEGPAPVAAGLQHFGAQDIGRHKVGRELDAVGLQAHHRAQSVHQPRLAQPRQADQQRVAATQHRGKDQIHDLFLPDETPVDRGLGLAKHRAQRLDFRDKRLGVGHASCSLQGGTRSVKRSIPSGTNGKRRLDTNDRERGVNRVQKPSKAFANLFEKICPPSRGGTSRQTPRCTCTQRD